MGCLLDVLSPVSIVVRLEKFDENTKEKTPPWLSEELVEYQDDCLGHTSQGMLANDRTVVQFVGWGSTRKPAAPNG